ncbi:MAG: glycosyltransferase family 4 protein [Geminicoccaceae bacterium]
MSRRLTLAYPGDLDSRTGGYLYDRRLALELEALGWQVDRLSLPAGFPFPSAADLATTATTLGELPAGSTVLVDGLALGAMPDLAAPLAARLDLVALVHHPLCLETGLAPVQAAALAASERTALADARAVIVTSARTAGSLTELFAVPPAKLTVALPGTDVVPVARGSDGHGCRMICVGTITPRKGHLVLVEALAELRDLDWDLVCAGSLTRDPPTAAALQALIREQALDPRVRLVGELDADGLAALYDGADLFVSASFYEGYGMALAEALARGLPIVAASGGAVADTVPADAGLLVPVEDADALALALRRFLTDPTLASSLRHGALVARRSLPAWQETALQVERTLMSVDA